MKIFQKIIKSFYNKIVKIKIEILFSMKNNIEF